MPRRQPDSREVNRLTVRVFSLRELARFDAGSAYRALLAAAGGRTVTAALARSSR